MAPRLRRVVVGSRDAWPRRSLGRTKLWLLLSFVGATGSTLFCVRRFFWYATTSIKHQCSQFDDLLQSMHDPSRPRRRPLSNLMGEGRDRRRGVVLFWHVAKTGGTTMKGYFAQVPGVTVYPTLKPGDFDRAAEKIERILMNPNTNQFLFVEFHGKGFPTDSIDSHLLRWRKLSEAHDVPLFVFTLFREPVSYAVSFFNFFNVLPKGSEKTEEAFKSTVQNRQCQTLARRKASPQVCANLYKTVLKYFDWVGHVLDTI